VILPAFFFFLTKKSSLSLYLNSPLIEQISSVIFTSLGRFRYFGRNERESKYQSTKVPTNNQIITCQKSRYQGYRTTSLHNARTPLKKIFSSAITLFITFFQPTANNLPSSLALPQ
jgi:hypothetical protein